MRNNVLWRKESSSIMMLAEVLDIDAERALNLFYSTETYRQLSNPQYELHLMSDKYLVDNIFAELQ